MESRKVDDAHAKILNICKQLMEEENGIFFLWWCSTNVQLADNLTKIVTPSALEFTKYNR